MSETAPQYRPEAEEATADSYERIQMLASDVIFDQAKKRIISELESDESLVEYARLNNHENELSAKVRESQDVSEQGKYYSEIELIRDQKDMLPQGTGALYERLNSRYRMLEEYNTLIVDADSFEGKAIGKIIKEAPKLQPETEAAAPFSNFKENDEESWQHVPNEAIDDYLDHRIFRSPTSNRIGTDGLPKITVEGSRDNPIEVPTGLMVGAQCFDSWKGYDGGRGGKGISGKYAEHYDRQASSYDVIKHYASLPTELPAISTAYLFIQPNGIIFGDNGSGDSHRLSAAILRGDETIRACKVIVTPINRNVFN